MQGCIGMLKEKKFGVISLGCDKNRVDTEKMLGMIQERGYAVTDDASNANILIVNTCGFLNASREESVETVLEFAEYKQQNLEKIVIPDGYLSVGEWAFQYCPNLKEIYIGKDVNDFTSADPFAFSNRLSVITVDPENTTYKSQNNCLLTKDGKTLVAGCKTSVIPDTVEVIGENAFCNIQSLSQITIPDSVTTIKDCAFSGCHQLTDIYLPKTITEIGCRAFHDCPILTVRCEAPERPAGWHEGWDGRNLGETTDRYPVPNVIWGAEPVS